MKAKEKVIDNFIKIWSCLNVTRDDFSDISYIPFIYNSKLFRNNNISIYSN